MQLLIDTPAYKRVTAAGFQIGEPEMQYIPERTIYRFTMPFTCICGRTEMLVAYYDCDEAEKLQHIDGAELIEGVGALSVEHLRKDGYTEEQIKQIRRAYD